MRHWRWVDAPGHEPSYVGHVHHQGRPHLVSNRTENLEIQQTRISRCPRQQHRGLDLLGLLSQSLVVNALPILLHSVGVEVIEHTGEVLGVAVGQVTPVIEGHAQNTVMGRTQGHQRRHVGLGPAVGLHICPFRTKKLLGPIASQVFDRVHVLAATVVASAGVALRVLVGQG